MIFRKNGEQNNRTFCIGWTRAIVDCSNSVQLFLTEKITQRKRQHGGQGQKSFNAIEKFCERFDKAVKNTLAQV